MEPLAYLPGTTAIRAEPLGRFLPPLPAGLPAAWLGQRLALPPGSWVLDPFGASPRLAVEAARLGYRVLVAANNPVGRFLLEMHANPPPEGELKAALAELGAARKGEERLEKHIRGLYLTTCPGCSAEIPAEAFLWERERPAPYARLLTCTLCGKSGEFPITPQDEARAGQFSASGLHHARALERVAPPDDPDRPHVAEALETYLPRAVYALFTLLNKLDGLALSQERKRLIQALLLSACDRANTLWPHPSGRARPRLLTIPPRYRENNIWQAMEDAIPRWAADSAHLRPLPLTVWPELPPENGGVCLFEGPLRELSKTNAGEHSGGSLLSGISAVLAALPRPNQAYWTLCALWAGWLWGRQAAGQFKSVLRRRRYDWAWHTSALHAAFDALASVCSPDLPVLGLVGEAEPGFLTAALVASQGAGLRLEGLALRSAAGQMQIAWRLPAARLAQTGSPGVGPAASQPPLAELTRKAAQAYLRSRGEPSTYLPLHAAALQAICEAGDLSSAHDAPAETFTLTAAGIEEGFSFRGGFIRFGGSEKSQEVGHWWLREPASAAQPLSDRAEVALVRFLLKNPGAASNEIDTALCTAFPGLLTPDPEVLEVLLDSYAEQDPSESGHWRVSAHDAPQARRQDLAEMSTLLGEVAARLGIASEGQEPVLWRSPAGEAIAAIYIIASAVVGEIILNPQPPPAPGWIVLPGSRANLLAYKLNSDARLALAARGWRWLKFRQVRYLAESPLISVENLAEQLSLDPMTYSTPQLRLL